MKTLRSCWLARCSASKCSWVHLLPGSPIGRASAWEPEGRRSTSGTSVSFITLAPRVPLRGWGSFLPSILPYLIFTLKSLLL